MEAEGADGAVAHVEPETTWREALSARLRPSDQHVSDEEIFAILNGGSEGVTAAELCEARGVTMPMYCVWKSKYRQLDLDQLSAARRREQRRHQTVVGLVLLTAVVVTGGVTVSLVWIVSSTFKVMAESTLAIPPAGSEQPHRPITGGADSVPARSRAPQAATRDLRAEGKTMPPATPTPTVVETGYRIQVTAEKNARDGRAAVALLDSRGYPAYMTQAVVGNSDVYRVRVGPFDTLAAAEEMATRLRSDGYGGAWIVR